MIIYNEPSTILLLVTVALVWLCFLYRTLCGLGDVKDTFRGEALLIVMLEVLALEVVAILSLWYYSQVSFDLELYVRYFL